MPKSEDALHGIHAGILRAYDAETLDEIWTSEQNPTRDRIGTLMKFVPPVVVNGRVYLPNHDGQVAVYGLLPQDFTLAVSPAGQIVTPGGAGTFSVAVGALGGFSGSVALSASGYPAGVTVAFAPQAVTGAGAATMTVRVPSTQAASFSITVAGTSGGRTHAAKPVSVTVGQIQPGLGSIGIEFCGTTSTAMSADESAGVVPIRHWNAAPGATPSTPLRLVDDTGALTGATATWTAYSTWALPITDQPGNVRMMKGYLDTSKTSVTTVTVAGLVARAYDVYVYADGDNRTYARTGSYSITGPGITPTTIELTDPANTNFSSTFTAGNDSTGNYVKFTIRATGFTLSAVPTLPASGTRRAPVNGIQIVPVGPPPAVISVDFVGNGVAMGAAEVAGVVARSNWNRAVGASRGTPLALVDEAGATTAATMTWAANGGWATPILDHAGDARMMKGYLDTSSTSVTTVTIAGLASNTYDVYVYVDGDNRTYSRSAEYTIGGAGFSATTRLTDPANTNFAGTFTKAANSTGNYVKFTITGSGFTLSARPMTGTNATLRAPVNGVQIVPLR